MPKPFTTIVPPSFKVASETYQYAPAVRIGDQILVSGIVGADAEGRFPPDFRSQAENVFATLDDVASLRSYHVGDLHSQLRELVDIKAKRIRPPHGATVAATRGSLSRRREGQTRTRRSGSAFGCDGRAIGRASCAQGGRVSQHHETSWSRERQGEPR